MVLASLGSAGQAVLVMTVYRSRVAGMFSFTATFFLPVGHNVRNDAALVNQTGFWSQSRNSKVFSGCVSATSHRTRNTLHQNARRRRFNTDREHLKRRVTVRHETLYARRHRINQQ
eukprot:15462711-Alexandrium_andersonii.AAC.1